ncbi:cilia- and flagella-associated protein 221 [Salminus brasiliensis]|uniref:cilia- and flagella-associated protein 221 n=1 Tax=Salminus brasiliensis TaxID=930266 RepID=UPI003B836B36
MEAVLQAPKTFAKNEVKKKKILPLSQLVEEKRRTGNVSHHLLETRVYVKFKSNNVVEADPPDLHFHGFKVGKDYKKVVKLINISSEVLNIHILPTQTKYFRTEYTKKSRLVPGLSYTIIVHFSPNEWRYYFDSIRVHCQGEENLLVPVHAYPVIDDLHIPSHIRLPAVPLGHSITHVIPLSCSCPIDFEFQVHCLQLHEAFTIQPLSGVIPANGKTNCTVMFTPNQYGTAEITLQLIISQFNSKPFICTLTASCSPQLTLGQPGNNEERYEMLSQDQKTEVPVPLPAAHKLKLTGLPAIEKSSAVDVSTPAGLAKMLIQPQDKMSYMDLRKVMSHAKTAHQTRQMREASFENEVRLNAQKERVSYLQWQVHLGEVLSSTEQKMDILKEQEFAAAEYITKKDTGSRKGDFDSVLPKLSLHRAHRNAGQTPDCIPAFYIYGSSQLEVRQRVLRLFQQAAYKVILQCRMNIRLLLLQELASSMKKQMEGQKGTRVDENPQLLNMLSENHLSFMLPIYTPTDQQDEFAVNRLRHVHVRTFRADLTTSIPFFNLKVPQHYRAMGYQEVSVYDARASFVHFKLSRPLCIGAQDELLPTVMFCAVKLHEEKEVQEEFGSELNNPFSFNTPENLKHPLTAHPLRIFNPAPSVYAFKPTPYYLESDLELYLCPLPIHTKGSIPGIYTSGSQKKVLDIKDIIKGIMIPFMAQTFFSTTSSTTSNWVSCMSDPFSSSLLPLEAPPALNDLPLNIREEILSGVIESGGVSLTPEMVQTEFAVSQNSKEEV